MFDITGHMQPAITQSVKMRITISCIQPLMVAVMVVVGQTPGKFVYHSLWVVIHIVVIYIQNVSQSIGSFTG